MDRRMRMFRFRHVMALRGGMVMKLGMLRALG